MKQPIQVVKAIPSFRQRYQMYCALTCLETLGREFSPKLNIVSELNALVGKDFLKKHYKKKYPEVKKKINALKMYVAEINSYLNGIKQKLIDPDDVTSKIYLNYRKALGEAYAYIFLIDELWVLLLKETDLKDVTVASDFWGALAGTRKEVFESAMEKVRVVGREYEGGREEPEEEVEEESEEGKE